MLCIVYLYLYICISVHVCITYVCILLCCIEIILKKNSQLSSQHPTHWTLPHRFIFEYRFQTSKSLELSLAAVHFFNLYTFLFLSNRININSYFFCVVLFVEQITVSITRDQSTHRESKTSLHTHTHTHTHTQMKSESESSSVMSDSL